jgi:hypothetical protein
MEKQPNCFFKIDANGRTSFLDAKFKAAFTPDLPQARKMY